MAKLEDIVQELSNLTVVEAADLAKLLEEHWGVSAAVAVPVAAAAAATVEAVVQSEFNVIMTAVPGDKKLSVIKAVRELDPSIGLTDAKKFVENLPYTVKEGVSKSEAEQLKGKLEGQGATIVIK